ncbi:hypothetical protein [Nocardioides sp. TF02-7]|uniref:hypothetical protein n=1 Tax=Nocardioides sp. TF02-7 TaxID=2917724 RepID=UPI001F053657|nr:hypothetical protein [Nocardioides sp. TF02-7]UMG94985.1 hypothetical protein MF408_20085 [Nocardioides sp. TF02-7]
MTAIPANPSDRRKGIGNNRSADRESATVTAENTTVRPAVRMAITTADSTERPPAAFLTEPGDQEQAVVHRQSESQSGRQVEGVARHGRGVGDQAEHCQRPDDRSSANEEGQACRDRRSEDQQQYEKGDRQGHHLRRNQVALRLFVHRQAHRRRTGRAHVQAARRPLEVVDDPSRRLLRRVLATCQLQGNQGCSVVGCAQ